MTQAAKLRPPHPFPARMAPELIHSFLALLPPCSKVLDPMAGSGATLRVATDLGHSAFGFDVDPLAVIIARTWTSHIDPHELRETAATIMSRVAGRRHSPLLPWIDKDPETKAFVSYWFATPQAEQLRAISAVLYRLQGRVADALRLALSRTIITKERGASLARDVSHSRPHRAAASNDYDVFDAFLRSVDKLAASIEKSPARGRAYITLGDARALRPIANDSIDMVITSPPYLNAIDYMRGHRLSLIWFGYRLSDLRAIRSNSIGTERALPLSEWEAVDPLAIRSLGRVSQLPTRESGIVARYLCDLHKALAEIYRVLRPGSQAVLVTANSQIRGVPISNSLAVAALAASVGLKSGSTMRRQIRPSARYLPPPRKGQASPIGRRMRFERIQTFIKSA